MPQTPTPPPAPTHKRSRLLTDAPAAKSPNRRWVWIAGAVLGLLLVVLIAVALSGRDPAPVVTTNISARVNQPVDRRTVGAAEAPVFIEVYEDYQCPHCYRYTQALESTILDELVAAGTVRYEIKNRFVIGPDSIFAALAAECAADQGRYWEYHDLLFAALHSENRPASIVTYKSLAPAAGLDQDAFDTCVDSQDHYDVLQREDRDARDRGVNATPTIFINGQQYQGDFDVETFKAAVTAAQESAGS